jgi:hypothetical protein
MLVRLLEHLPDGLEYLSLQKDLNESERRISAAHFADFNLGQELNLVETAAQRRYLAIHFHTGLSSLP